MVVEELLTNMVNYNGNGAENIMVSVERDGDWMRVNLVDYDSEPFDYTESAEVGTSAPPPLQELVG